MPVVVSTCSRHLRISTDLTKKGICIYFSLSFEINCTNLDPTEVPNSLVQENGYMIRTGQKVMGAKPRQLLVARPRAAGRSGQQGGPRHRHAARLAGRKL
jgi:hypothetical protein